MADTADYTNTPLDHHNITGVQQVIGIADTGIDMMRCEADCQPNLSYRRIFIIVILAVTSMIRIAAPLIVSRGMLVGDLTQLLLLLLVK